MNLSLNDLRNLDLIVNGQYFDELLIDRAIASAYTLQDQICLVNLKKGIRCSELRSTLQNFIVDQTRITKGSKTRPSKMLIENPDFINNLGAA